MEFYELISCYFAFVLCIYLVKQHFVIIPRKVIYIPRDGQKIIQGQVTFIIEDFKKLVVFLLDDFTADRGEVKFRNFAQFHTGHHAV